jgi:diphosphomevalonate decarboxylase
MESSTLKMHATMHTARPPLLYWKPDTVRVMHAVFALREAGMNVWMTMDAGPQVKILCRTEDADRVCGVIQPLVRACHVLAPGPGAYLETSS